MNKALTVSSIMAVIIGIIIVSAVVSNDTTGNDTDSEVISEEPIPIENPEIIGEGRDLSVEFTESINMKTP